MDPPKRRHQRLLIEISDAIDKSQGSYELERFNTAVGELLPRGTLSENPTVIKKLDALTVRGELKPGKYEKLKGICDQADLKGVRELIENAEREIAGMSAGGSRDQETVHAMDRGTSTSTRNTGQREIPGDSVGQPMDFSGDRSGMAAQSGSVDVGTSGQSDRLYKTINGKEYYNTDGKKKGLLLILDFRQGREGLIQAVQNLRLFFEGDLRFDIRDPRSDSLRDLTKAELERSLLEARTTLNTPSNEYYCFVCVILSHGNKDGVLTRDKTYDPSEIRTFFNNSAMPHFAGRPKLFFVDACRGCTNMYSVRVPLDSNVSDRQPAETHHAIPIEADTLLAYATTPGHRAYANLVHENSYFIGFLYQVFNASYRTDHVEEMMITVKERTAGARIEVWADESKTARVQVSQMPCTWSTLTRRLLFKYT